MYVAFIQTMLNNTFLISNKLDNYCLCGLSSLGFSSTVGEIGTGCCRHSSRITSGVHITQGCNRGEVTEWVVRTGGRADPSRPFSGCSFTSGYNLLLQYCELVCKPLSFFWGSRSKAGNISRYYTHRKISLPLTPGYNLLLQYRELVCKPLSFCRGSRSKARNISRDYTHRKISFPLTSGYNLLLQYCELVCKPLRFSSRSRD